jgi:hypothetical protein
VPALAEEPRQVPALAEAEAEAEQPQALVQAPGLQEAAVEAFQPSWPDERNCKPIKRFQGSQQETTGPRTSFSSSHPPYKLNCLTNFLLFQIPSVREAERDNLKNDNHSKRFRQSISVRFF